MAEVKERKISNLTTKYFLMLFESYRFIKVTDFLINRFAEGERWISKMNLIHTLRLNEGEANRTVNTLMDLGVIKKKKQGGLVGYNLNMKRYLKLSEKYHQVLFLLKTV